jgi:2-keto-3-deoxy-L-rhamnonate aldolase RhmA
MTGASPSLRERLAARQELIGSFVLELPTRAAIECYALAGFDFLVLDLEHSSIDLGLLSTLIATCHATALACLVRIEAGTTSSITRILDMGPTGVMAPGVRSPAEAAAVVAAARYQPAGRRGLAPIVRHELQEGCDLKEREAQTVVALQLEALDALPEARAVATTPGVDVVFVGPYDLSQSVGYPGHLDHPEVVAAGEELGRRVVPHAALGVYLERPEQIRRWRGTGATFFTLRTDGRIFVDACRRTLSEFRGG